MKKVKWLHANMPLPIAEVSQKFLSNQYDENSGNGFLLSFSTNKIISGKYIEKVIEKSLITDPFGNVEEFSIPSYFIVQFNIDSSLKLIELINPPHSLHKFISKMQYLLGLGLELSELDVNPFIWLTNIEKNLAPMVVTNISLTNIRIPDNGLAKISVSGKKDIRNEFKKIISDKNYIIETIKFNGNINDCNIAVEINKTGLAKVNGHIYDDFLVNLKNCLVLSL